MNLVDGSSKLVIPTFDQFYVVWNGKGYTKNEISDMYGIHTISKEEAENLVREYTLPIYLFEGEGKEILGIKNLKNVTNKRMLLWAVQECRVTKQQWELQLIRKAGIISGNAHMELMKSLKNTPLTTEKKLQAIFEYECAKNNAYVQAYNPIVAVGKNASYLHYGENSADVGKNPNELLLIDAGGEYEGYASDITRSYPVSGKFTDLAKTIYNIVLKMQLDVIKELKPGVKWRQLQTVAFDTAITELKKVCLL